MASSSKTSEISTLEVKRWFLLANAMKEEFRHHKELGIDVLVEEYKRELDYLQGLNEDKLSKRITDKVRLQRYDSMAWHNADINLSDAGVWPKMQGMDILLTIGNVSETALEVRKVLEGRSEKDIPPETKKKIESIISIADFIYPRFPVIVFPGGEVREKDYNSWARKNNEPLCKIFDYDIDDGCTRSIAYSLEGIKTIPTLIGKYRN
ncbi:hypothetical protein HY212_03115 [Candidatus Pacearchaeota archaeon]|nr:hypothetical protein [Candidatus Pacearchaeota archaeon]